MQAGLLAEYGLIRYHLSASATSAGSGPLDYSASGTASLEQIIATSPVDADIFLAIRFQHIRQMQNGQESLSQSLRIILGSLYDQQFADASSGSIEFEGCKLYLIKANPPYFRFQAEQVRIYAGGLLQQSFSGFNALGYYIAPAGVPGFAPARISAAATADASAWPPNSINFAEISLSISGGFSLDGAGLPISIQILPAPPYSCPVPAYPFPSISGSDSDSLSIQVYARKDIQDQGYLGGGGMRLLYELEERRNSCQIWLAPAIASGWIPLSSDSNALVDRYALPSAWKRSTATTAYHYHDDINGIYQDCSDSPTSSELVFAERAAGIIRIAGESLFPALPCPYSASSHYGYSYIQGLLDILKQSDLASDYPILSAPSGMLNYLTHSDPYLRYWNLCLHPVWSHFLRFADWPGGDPLAPIPASNYWRPMRLQWLIDSALPPEDRTRRRLHPMLEPFNESDLAEWLAGPNGYALPAPTWWAGASRFKVLGWQPAGQLALAPSSEPRWSFENATAFFGPTGITITPTALTCRARFQLADDAAPPYLYPQLADAIRIVAAGANIAGIAIYAVSAEGEQRACEALPDNWWDLAGRQEDSFSAATWEMDTLWPGDRGFDLLPNGRSIATAQDRFRRSALQLLFASPGKEIVIEFALSALAPFALDYPIFRWDASQSLAVPLTANTSAILRSRNGWQYLAYDPIQRAVRDPSWWPSLLEWLALRRMLPLGQSPDGEAIWGEAAAIYDAAELLPADAPLDQRLADLRTDTRSVPHPLQARDGEPLFLMISAPAEIPPLAMIPARRRNPQSLMPDPQQELGFYAYYLSPTRRYYANPQKPAELWKDDSGQRQMLSSLYGAHGSWRISYLDLALNGDEVVRTNLGELKANPKWLIAVAGLDYGRVSPFWGFWCSLVPPPGAPGVLLIDSRRGWIHYSLGSHLLGRYQYQFSQFLDRDLGQATHSLALDSRLGMLYIATHNLSAHHIYRSSNAGGAVEEMLMIQADSSCLVAASEVGRLILFYYDGGAKMRYSLDRGTTWSQPIAIQKGGAPMNEKPLSADWDARAQCILLLYEAGSGQYGLARSTDLGASFEDIL